MMAYVFPAKNKALSKLRIDQWNISEPCPIYSGPHAGKIYLDADLAKRDPRWIPCFSPLVEDAKNGVELVDLDIKDVSPINMPFGLR